MDKLLLGIDFGTSTNFVTKYDFAKKDAVAVANMGKYGGKNIFDNCIYIESDGKYILGDPKKSLADPFNFFSDIKRFITSNDWKHKVPNLDNRDISAQDLAQMIFEAIRKKVEENENQQVDGAVITVPYAYGDVYKTRIKEAAENAGIRVIKLVEEPVAAAISFGLFDSTIENNKKEKIVVFDLGGGTFDITVFEFQKNNAQHAKIEVMNTDGVENLGGRDVDFLISDKLRTEVNIEYTDFENKKEKNKFINKLSEVSREAKEALSAEEGFDIYEPLTINSRQIELEKFLERNELNLWLKDNNVIGQITDALERAIDDAEIEVEEIDKIVLAGGTSTIPIIKETVKKFFGKNPESKKNLGELVGHGAGILAGLSEDNSLNYEIIRKTSKAIGIASGNKFNKIMPKNYRYGETSAKKKVKLKPSTNKLNITFYEGDSCKIDACEKVGKSTIDGSAFPEGEISISLSREEDSGRMRYFFHDKNNKLITSDFIQSMEG